MATKSPFSSVVFAGGGSRCLWQVGFWSVVAPGLKLKPETVTGVSAGASMACLIFAGTAESTLEFFKALTAANKKNCYPSNLFNGEPVFPHYRMYRAGILHGIDRKGLARIKKGPDIRIMISRIPKWLGPRSATFVGTGIYLVERCIRKSVHPVGGTRFGYAPEVFSVRDCATPEELADLIIASSCTPPFTPIQTWNGRPSLDGGFVDNVPVRALPEKPGRTLVLLSRPYPESSIPQIEGRVYVQPSQKTPITKWDYTSPRGLQGAYDLGRKDGESFLRSYGKDGRR